MDAAVLTPFLLQVYHRRRRRENKLKPTSESLHRRLPASKEYSGRYLRRYFLQSESCRIRKSACRIGVDENDLTPFGGKSPSEVEAHRCFPDPAFLVRDRYNHKNRLRV